jgi:threonine/homoserine/homoserine lactone efflux protein
VLWQAIGAVFPTALAVALSPIPIVGIVLVLAGPRARTAGPAFALGWVVGLTAVSVVVLVVAGGSSDPDSASATGVNWLLVGLGLLFLVLAARQWRTRPRAGETTELPAWMATIDHVTPSRAAVLGVALSAANPKNLALTIAAAASIAEAGISTEDEAIAVAVFVVIGSLTVVGAMLFAIAAPRRSAAPLAAVKQFMSDHNAVIMMVILLILGAKLIGDGLGGLGS